MKSFENLFIGYLIGVVFLAVYGAFDLYGFIGLFSTLFFAVIVPSTILIYYDNKRSKIVPKSHDNKEFERYDDQANLLDIKEYNSYVFLWFMPLSLIIIIYLYFEVEYGGLLAVLYILFNTYNILQLNNEALISIKKHQKYYPERDDEISIESLEENIKISENRLSELNDAYRNDLKQESLNSNVETKVDPENDLEDKSKKIETNWFQRLWDWAEICKLDENVIPRNKVDLLNLESLKLSPYDIALSYPSSNYTSGRLHINIRKDSDIEELPIEIGNLINLKELSLDMTNITSLPKEIGNLANLEVLSLDSTNITELPLEIAKLKKLKKLLMRNTEINTIPKEIQNMENLKIWSVDRNS